MSSAELPTRGKRLAPRAAAVAIATITAAMVVAVSPSPAQSAASSECPEAFPVGSLDRDQAVTGLTVSQGTRPDGFTGEVIGVLEDGIAPGVDMVMVRLRSPEIDRVGVWSGMSGSPVYAEDGRLIGAVSYGLAYGPSPVAGVTPAGEMKALLGEGANSRLEPTRRVKLPQRMQERIVAEGAATAAEVDNGMSQLRLPFGIAGVGQPRFDDLVERLDVRNVRAMRIGKAAGGAVDASAIKAGGNLGAAVSYGDVSFAGIGTATAVCGEEVVGFGHPLLWGGRTSLTLHPADAVYVQEDAFVGFKVANLGGPVGTIDQDRIAGIAGAFGAVPRAGKVTSTARSGTKERIGTSRVNLSEWMPEVAFAQVLANTDRVVDGRGKGSGETRWVVRGTREDGTPFTIHRSDVYADPGDITSAMVSDLYTALSSLEFNGVEDLTIDSVTTDSTLSRTYKHATIDAVSVRRHGRWVPLGSKTRRVDLRAGRTARFQVTLDVVGAGPSKVVLTLPVRRRDLGQRGSLDITGGWALDGELSSNAKASNRKAVDNLIKEIRTAPRNDDVIATMSLLGGPREKTRDARKSTGIAVDGRFGIRVRIVR